MISRLLMSPLAEIAEKVSAGVRLSHEDGALLYRSRDIHEIGRLANIVRERLHGDAAYYNVNRHINYTNFCVLRCKFCSFYRPYGKTAVRPEVAGERISLPISGSPRPDGYELSADEVAGLAEQAYEAGATEVHIVGGLHPRLPFSYYLQMCRAIREDFRISSVSVASTV